MTRIFAKFLIDVTLGQFENDEHFAVSVAVAGVVAVSVYYLYGMIVG